MPIEDALQDHLAVCLCGMPGAGRKTAVSMLLEKHPEVKPVFCSVEEMRADMLVSGQKAGGGQIS